MVYHTPSEGCVDRRVLSFESAFTGYIDIEARHIFFYFFESRSDPDKDDVIFWTNGGPGCSSSLGLLMELGSYQLHMTLRRYMRMVLTRFVPYTQVLAG